MPDTTHSPDVTAALSAWIHRLTALKDDVLIFGLERRGIANNLADLVHDMQEIRKRAGQ